MTATTEKFIAGRRQTDHYRMRASAAYPGDWVTARESVINGKRFEFSRVEWADGTVTVAAYEGGTTNILHQYQWEA